MTLLLILAFAVGVQAQKGDLIQSNSPFSLNATITLKPNSQCVALRTIPAAERSRKVRETLQPCANRGPDKLDSYLTLVVNALGVSPTPTVTPTPFPTTPTSELTLAPTPKPINGLTYFGYWGSSGDGITFDETSAYSNLVWIGDTNISRLSTISHHSGMKAIIYPYNTFFDTNFRLRSDYQIRWNALAAQIKPYVDNKTVIAINPLDEPMWNASQNGISSSDMKSAMESINTSIKQTFPGMTTVMIEAYSMVNPSMITPTGYDWIGFDCYGSWDYCNGHSISEYASIIKSKLSSNQRLILLPDAIYHGLAPSVSDQNLIASKAEQYYQLAVSQGAVAFMPFYYISFDANHTVAKDMPIVKSKYEELGRRILGLAPTITPTLTITPTPTPNITPTPTPVSGGPSGYVFCASEDQFCAFSNTRSVAYGANGRFNYLTLTGGTNCSNTVFNDPIYGVAKACYTKEVIGSTPTPTVTPTPFPPTPTPTPSVSVWMGGTLHTGDDRANSSVNYWETPSNNSGVKDGVKRRHLLCRQS